MNYLISILRVLQPVGGTGRELVRRLFALSSRSMTALIAFSVVVCYYLYPALHNTIIYWGGALILIALLRLGLVVYFRRYEEQYPAKQWYRIFFLFTMITGLLISMLGAWFIPKKKS